MAELGKNLLIYSGSTGTTPIIAMAKSCTVSRKADAMEKSSSASATAKEFIAGRTEWDIQLSHLLPANSNDSLKTLLMVGQTYGISVVLGDARMTGTVLCLEADLQGSVGSLASGSVKLKGTGELSAGT